MYNGKIYEGYELAELLQKELVGKQITEITSEKIVLNNGKILRIVSSSSSRDFWAGWIDRAKLDIIPSNPNIEASVINVEYKDTNKESLGSFKIFIYMTNNTFVTIKGNNGKDNDFYGSGFLLSITQ